MAAEGGFEIVPLEHQEQTVFTAGARRKPAPKAVFRRWTAMKVMIFW